jgi:transposase-like protein
MISSVIPARLEFSCGHAALVTLPRLKGEGASQRTERVNQEKTAARSRPCDFCGPSELPPFDVHSGRELALADKANGHHVLETKENVMTTTETPPTSAEPVQEPVAPKTSGAPSVTRLGAEEAKRTFPPRRRLGDDQEREVTRLYVETTTPVAQIGQQFGIGESSVYRIAQRNGAALRGRQPAPAATDGVAAATPAPAPAAAAPAPVAAPPAVAAAAKPARTPRANATPAAPVAPVTPVAPVAATPAAKPRRGRKPAAPAPAPAASKALAVKPAAAVAKPVAPAKTPRARATPAAPVAVAAPVVSARAVQLRFRIRFNAETVVEAVDIRAALRHLDTLGATDVQAITREA